MPISADPLASPATLLPAFVPSPSSSRPTSPSPSARPRSPLFNLATAAAAPSQPVHQPRPRSRSLRQHWTESARTSSRLPPPPLPLPLTPPSPAFASSSSKLPSTPPSPRTLAEAAGSLVLAVSGLGLDIDARAGTTQTRRIRKVTVPHSTKAESGTLFACRVVPFALDHSPPATAAAGSASMSREPSLGPMEIAGQDGSAATAEPYTVYRSWVECSTLSIALNAAFAGMPGLPKLGPTARGLGFIKGGVSDVQREAVLDKFMCRLFGMPQGVRDCDMVRDFFGARNDEAVAGSPAGAAGSPTSVRSPGGWGEVRGATEDGSVAFTFSDFLSRMDTGASPSPRAVVFPSPASATPLLKTKASSASLRTQRYDSLTNHPNHCSPESFIRPLILGRAATSADLNAARSSRHSNRTSASSSSSTTATPYNTDSTSRAPTPMARLGPTPTHSRRSSSTSQRLPALALALAKADPNRPSPLGLPELVAAVGQQKKPKLLRAVRSLGDLRKIRDLVSPAPVPDLPATPVKCVSPKAASPGPGPSPKPFGFAMLRQLSGPLSPATGLGSSAMARGMSKASHTGADADDDEELWGTSTEYVQPQPVATGFREAPNGRLESLSRRPSISRAPNSAPRAYAHGHGHKSSLSGSSLASARSGVSSVDLARSMSDRGGYFSSARTSADYSVSDRSSIGHGPSTPPTPGSEYAYAGVSMGRYREENGKLVTNQTFVVQQPFYSLPPPMTMSKSCEGPGMSPTLSTGSRSHTRKSSLEHPHRRARVSSSASVASMQLETILASPNQACFPRAGLHPAPPLPPFAAKEFVEFKLKHPKDTFRKRFPTKGLDYAALRRHVLDAFEGSEAGLGEAEGGWGLIYSVSVNGAGRTRVVDGQRAFEEMMREQSGAGKVVLNVVSA